MANKTHPTGGWIYGLRCRQHPESGIRYVGKTTALLPSSRFSTHKWAARKADRKLPVAIWMHSHGVENIEQVILEECLSIEELNDREKYWIDELCTQVAHGKRGLNITPGGDGGIGITGEAAKRRAETMRRRYPGWGQGRARPGKARGSRSGVAKINEEQARNIKELIWDGVSQKDVALMFGLSKSSIGYISQGVTWAHVPWPNDRPRVVLTTSDRKKIEARSRERTEDGRFR